MKKLLLFSTLLLLFSCGDKNCPNCSKDTFEVREGKTDIYKNSFVESGVKYTVLRWTKGSNTATMVVLKPVQDSLTQVMIEKSLIVE
jgi:hypothetical protein